jgi:flagellar motility protein MotE (MotC chaperone)
MTRVEAIEEEIKKLSSGELAELRDWLLENEWAEWDEQIERDAAEGKLEKLFSKARADHAAGKSTKL